MASSREQQVSLENNERDFTYLDDLPDMEDEKVSGKSATTGSLWRRLNSYLVILENILG